MAYEINIHINGEIEEGGVVGTTSGGVSESVKPTEQQKAVKSLGKYVATQTIQPFIQNVKTQVSQNIGIVTGQTSLQERVNFGMEVVQYGVNAFKNAQAGALIGAGLGIGSGAGALIGLSLTAISTMIQIEFNKQRLDLENRMENYQLEQVRTRQGSAYNKSRMGV